MMKKFWNVALYACGAIEWIGGGVIVVGSATVDIADALSNRIYRKTEYAEQEREFFQALSDADERDPEQWAEGVVRQIRADMNLHQGDSVTTH